MNNETGIVQFLKKEQDRLTKELRGIGAALAAFGKAYGTETGARKVSASTRVYCTIFSMFYNQLLIVVEAAGVVVLHLRAAFGDRNFRICDFLSALRGYDKQSIVR